VHDEDDIRTDLPLIPREKRQDSNSSEATATTVSSRVSWSSSSSSRCRTGSNIYNSNTRPLPPSSEGGALFVRKIKENNFLMDDVSVPTATTVSSRVSLSSSSSSYCRTGSNIYNSNTRSLPPSSKGGVFFVIKNKENNFLTDDVSVATAASFVDTLDGFTAYCDLLEENTQSMLWIHERNN